MSCHLHRGSSYVQFTKKVNDVNPLASPQIHNIK